jgi:hypothetical protein
MSLDVNKCYHTSQENDDLLELVLKYQILIQKETNTLLTYYLLLYIFFVILRYAGYLYNTNYMFT